MFSGHKKLISAVGMIVFAVVLAGGGYAIGYRAGTLNPKTVIVKGVTGMEPNQAVPADFSTFWQAWATIDENYLRAPQVSSQDKVYGAINGLVESLGDPYSEFFNPVANKKFQDDIQGNFGGIGAEIGVKKNQIVVIAPLKDTPASHAGLKAGDAILKINASSTEGMAVDQAVNLIRGPKETTVTLLIFRNGFDKPKEFKIVRDTIIVPTLDVTLKDNGIAYIAIHSFNANLESLFYQEVSKVAQQGVRGVVLDVRDDPGGYLDVAVNIAGWFMPRGTPVVSEESRIGPKQEERAQGNALLAKIPVVVLINQGSASASEILAGALRDERHAKLIGETSFGKGTVQQLVSLKDGSTIKLTIAHWVLPGGQILENGGLKPDIEVKATEENTAGGKDPQLEKAIEVLKTQIQ